MPAATLRLVAAELRSRRLTSWMLGLLIAVAAVALTVTLVVRSQMNAPFDRAMAETRGADVYAVTTRPGADLRPVADVPGIAASSGIRPTVEVTLPVAGRAADAVLEALGPAPAAVDQPAVRSGRGLGDGPGEVVLERSLAKAAQLRPGDTVAITAGGRTQRLRVVGTAVTAAVGPFERWDPAVAWARPATVRAVAHGLPLDGTLSVRLRPGVTRSDFMARAAAAAGSPSIGFYDSSEVRSSVTERARTVSTVVGTNTLLALLAVAFTLITAVGGRVIAQRRQIGVLKALGLTPAQTVLAIMAYYLALAAVAGLVGVAAGAALAHQVTGSVADALNTAPPSAVDLGLLGSSYLLILAAVAAATFVPAARAGRLATTAALATHSVTAARGPSRLASAAAALRLPVALRFGLKDAFAGRTRSVLTIGALMLMTVTVVAALSGESTFRKVIGDPALRAKPYELRLDSRRLPAQRVRERAAAHRDSVAAATTYAEEPARAAGSSTELTAGILGDQPQAFAYAVPDGRGLRGPGEALLGRGALDALGKRIGDRITITVLGRPVTLRIVGRHVEPDFDGKIVRFLASSLPAGVRSRLDTTTTLVRLRDKRDAGALAAALQRETHGALNPQITDDEVKQERADIRPGMVAGNLALLAIGLANLLTTLALGIREREGDLAIFKTLGATPPQVLAAIAAVAGLLASVGIAVGVPAGMVLIRALVVATNPSDGADVFAWPSASALAVALALVWLVAVAASGLPARRALRLRPTVVLRSE